MSKSAKALKLRAAVMRRVNRPAKKVNRKPSDLAAEALEWYLRVCALPEEAPTPAEVRAIHRGREAFKKGKYITLDESRREEAVVRRPRRTRAKSS
jgi:predicted transcriptional regulator